MQRRMPKRRIQMSAKMRKRAPLPGAKRVKNHRVDPQLQRLVRNIVAADIRGVDAHARAIADHLVEEYGTEHGHKGPEFLVDFIPLGHGISERQIAQILDHVRMQLAAKRKLPQA